MSKFLVETQDGQKFQVETADEPPQTPSPPPPFLPVEGAPSSRSSWEYLLPAALRPTSFEDTPEYRARTRQLSPKEFIESSAPARFLRGVEGPALKIFETLGTPEMQTYAAEIQRAKARGMAARSPTGEPETDVAGFIGSMVPASKVASGIAGAVAPQNWATRALTGATIGGTTAGMQPGSTMEQVGTGGGIGGLIPLGVDTVTRGVPALARGTGDRIFPTKMYEKWIREKVGKDWLEQAASKLEQAGTPLPGPVGPFRSGPAGPTAAEAVAGDPAGTVVQMHQKIIAKKPGGISSLFGERLGTQRESRRLAAEARDAVTDPLRETALGNVEANMQQYGAAQAGQAQAARGLRQAEKALGNVEKSLAPPSPKPPAPKPSDALRTQTEIFGQVTPTPRPPLRSQAEIAQRNILEEKRRAITQAIEGRRGQVDAAERTLADMGAQGFQPLSEKPLLGKIKTLLHDPEIPGPATKVLESVKQDIADAAEKGELTVRKLYAIRKEGLGNAIRVQQKEGARWDKKLSAKYERPVQEAIDDMIEAAGGAGWKEYLREYSGRTQQIADELARKKLSLKPEQPTALAGGMDIAAYDTRNILPSILSRPIVGARWLAEKAAEHLEPRIEQYAAQMYLHPQRLADVLRYRPGMTPQQDAVINALMRQGSTAAGVGIGRKE